VGTPSDLDPGRLASGLRVAAGPLSGQAPSSSVRPAERVGDASLQRTVLAGLTASLKGLPPGPVTFDMGDRAMQRAGGGGKCLSGAALSEAETLQRDLDLWAQLTTGLKGRGMTFRLGALTAGGPAAFAQAWPDLAMDKAKASQRPSLRRSPGRTSPG